MKIIIEYDHPDELGASRQIQDWLENVVGNMWIGDVILIGRREKKKGKK